MGSSANCIDARRQGRKEYAISFGGAPNTVSVLRVFLKGAKGPFVPRNIVRNSRDISGTVLRVFLRSAKGADARREGIEEPASPFGGAADIATAFRVFLRKVGLSCALFLLAGALPSLADDNGGRWLGVDFPHDSPVLAVSFSMGPSTAHVRGTSLALDLHASLVLRNVSNKALSGLTMRVETQALASGRGSVSVPSLTAQPGETFPVRVDMELLRPFNAPRNDTGPLVQVSLDCALFSDFSAYGPDNLHTRRSLMVYELEARRERQYLSALLKSGQLVQLREELNFGLPDSAPSRLGLEFLHDPRPTATREQALSVNPLAFRGAPVQPIGGSAELVGNEVRSPQVEVRNVSQKPVRSVELGWIVRDERGRDFMAGSVPATIPEGQTQMVKMTESAALRFSSASGQPLIIGALRAFINNVEFTDGKLWIPSRSDIDNATSDPVLRREIASSPEQQRLAKLYRQKGTAGLAEELKRLN